MLHGCHAVSCLTGSGCPRSFTEATMSWARFSRKNMLLNKTMRNQRHHTGSGGRCPRMPDHKDSSRTSYLYPLSTSVWSFRVMMDRLSGSAARNAVIAKYASPFTYISVDTIAVTAFCTLLGSRVCQSVREAMLSHTVLCPVVVLRQCEFHSVLLVQVCVGSTFTRTCRLLESYVSQTSTLL